MTATVPLLFTPAVAPHHDTIRIRPSASLVELVVGARPAVVGTETTTILRRWEIERLRRFRHGNKKLLHADGILAT